MGHFPRIRCAARVGEAGNSENSGVSVRGANGGEKVSAWSSLWKTPHPHKQRRTLLRQRRNSNHNPQPARSGFASTKRPGFSASEDRRCTPCSPRVKSARGFSRRGAMRTRASGWCPSIRSTPSSPARKGKPNERAANPHRPGALRETTVTKKRKRTRQGAPTQGVCCEARREDVTRAGSGMQECGERERSGAR